MMLRRHNLKGTAHVENLANKSVDRQRRNGTTPYVWGSSGVPTSFAPNTGGRYSERRFTLMFPKAYFETFNAAFLDSVKAL